MSLKILIKRDDRVEKFHKELLNRFGLPESFLGKCPECGKQLQINGLRSVELRLAASQIGNVVLEVCCFECSSLDCLHYRLVVDNIDEFCDILRGKRPLDVEPIRQKEIYKSQYNNVLEKMSAQKETSE